jgi:hypothetical protein
MRTPARAWTTNALIGLGSVVLTLLGIEGVLAFALSHPQILASGDGTVGKALAYARDYYVTQERRSVQYLPDCARYDPAVSYTLIPGARCRVATREYIVEYAANRAGLRDSDESLSGPEVVVIGDSHAMGWGVRGEESFPKRLQEIMSRPVLNAAMSSFGTVRELRLLERLKLPSVGTLVIQYSDNDVAENKTYIEDGALDILPEWQYRAVVEEHRLGTRYYPLKYAVSSVLSIAGLTKPSRGPASQQQSDNIGEARYFLDVLLRHRATVEGRTVVVLEINSYNQNDGRFVDALRGLLAERRYALLAPWVTAIDVSRALGPGDYYLLDGHMKVIGHEKVARLVAAELRRRSAAAPPDSSRPRLSVGAAHRLSSPSARSAAPRAAWLLVTTGTPSAAAIVSRASSARNVQQATKMASAGPRRNVSTANWAIASGGTAAISRLSVSPRPEAAGTARPSASSPARMGPVKVSGYGVTTTTDRTPRRASSPRTASIVLTTGALAAAAISPQSLAS